MGRNRISFLSLAVAGVLVTVHPARADEYADVDKLFGTGHLAEAVQRADVYLASNPRDARMRFLKGLMLSEQGRTNEAVAVFTKLTEDFPDLPEPYNNLAVIYNKQGQYDQARRALESAIRTNPSYATAYENLGDVYAKLASQAYARALQMDGTNNAKLSPKLAMIRELFSPQSIILAAAAPRVTTGKPAAPAPAVAAPSPATPPVATKPPVVAAAPASAPTPSPTLAAPSAADAADARAAVQAWANAWSRKDMAAYFAAYTKDFSGGKTRKAWEDERRKRIVGKRSISVVLTDFDTKVHGDKAVVQFRQAYTADALKVSSRKTLNLVRVSGQWLIQKESTGT